MTSHKGDQVDVSPSAKQIPWDSTDDSLMALATKYWEAIQPACKSLEAEYFGRGDLTEEERTRRAVGAVSRFKR